MLDTSFMIGFLIAAGRRPEDVEKYFRALRRAQRDIDVEHQQYTHYYLREMADEFKQHRRRAGIRPGERLVFEPYTREIYEQTHRWMAAASALRREQAGQARFESAVLV